MRIPVTKYGLPQAALYPAVILLLMGAYALFAWRVFPPELYQGIALWLTIILPEAAGLAVFCWALSFFRDPHRNVPQDSSLLLAPADGTITDIETLTAMSDFDGPVVRIGIFLSIFNVHINRMPCSAKVHRITYRPGKFSNAMNPQSGKTNECNELLLERTEPPMDTLLLRQISGAVARHIVCEVKEGDAYAAGRQFGMIKFGSRTELIYPVSDKTVCMVKIGDKVKAGETVLVKYEK